MRADRERRGVSRQAVTTFALTLIVAILLLVVVVQNRAAAEKATMEQLVAEKSSKIYEVVSRLLYKTQTLAAFVTQGDGEVDDFDGMAAAIIDDPAIKNVLLAPEGVVRHVYPLQGNEDVLGLDYFLPGAGNREAVLAKERNDLVFGGPFELVQGGQALVGRLPVYLPAAGRVVTEDDFWGFVSVTLNYPQALDGAGLSMLEMQGFSYEIWRTNPDDGQRQVIDKSTTAISAQNWYVEKKITIMNAEWYFRISPMRNWYQHTEIWMIALVGLFFSVMVALITQNNVDLKKVKTELEGVVAVDLLTGAMNRKGLFSELERLIRLDKTFLLYYIDLDHFKQVNDTYGHRAGDTLLVQFVNVVDSLKDGSHIFARISGDEFALVHVDENQDERNMRPFWQKLEERLAALQPEDGRGPALRLSIGLARYPGDATTADALVAIAENEMQMEKHRERGAGQAVNPFER